MAQAVFAALVQTGIAIATGGSLAFGQLVGYQAFLAWTATYAVLGAVSRSLFGQPAFDTMEGTNFNVRDPASTRKIIYGKVRIGGTIVFFNTSDTDNNFLHMVIAVAGHEIESFEEVYFGEEKVWENGSYLNNWDDHCRLNFHKGDQTTADSDLVTAATGFTNDHKLLDTAYIYARLDYDAEKFDSGVPNISCVIKGKKVYNPATQTTEWSDNPALILNDYLKDSKYGLGEVDANIDATALSTAQTICDGDISIGSGNTQKRYTCNGILDSASSIKANIENILSSMIGSMHYTDGKFYMLAHSYRTPHADAVTDDILVSPISVATKRSRATLYNTVKGKFIWEDANYVLSDYPAQVDSSYSTADGEEIALDLTLPMTTDSIRAQRLAFLTLEKSRQQMSISLEMNLTGLKYKVGDNIKVVHDRFGWTTNSPKIFEITNFTLVPDANRGLVVKVEAVENSDVEANWSVAKQQTVTLPAVPTVYTGVDVVPVTNVYRYNPTDNTKDIRIVWTGVEQSDGVTPYETYFSHYEVEYTNSVSSTSGHGTFETNNTYIELEHKGYSRHQITHTYKVYAVNTRGHRSTPVTVTRTTEGAQTGTTQTLVDDPRLGNYVEGTFENPTIAQLNELVAEKGIQIYNGLEVTYLQVDSNNVVINSIEYEWQSNNVFLQVADANNQIEVDAITADEILTNGDFSNGLTNWANNSPVPAITVTNGQLNLPDWLSTKFVYTGVDTRVVAPVNLSFDIVSFSGSNAIKVQLYNGSTYAIIAEQSYSTTGTKSLTFTPEGNSLLAIVGTVVNTGDGPDVTIDNVSAKYVAQNAIQKYRFYLPKSVTATVTFTHTETDKIGMTDNGVTETYTGFSGANLVHEGRKYVEVTLERAATSAGFSQFTTTITANWTETESLDGVLNTISKESVIEKEFTARVS